MNSPLRAYGHQTRLRGFPLPLQYPNVHLSGRGESLKRDLAAERP